MASTTDTLRAVLGAFDAEPIIYRRLRDSDLIGVVWISEATGEWGVGTVDEAANAAELVDRRPLRGGGLRRSVVTAALDNHLASLEAAR